MRSMLTITTPTNTHDLTTLDAAKLELGITDTANDDLILTLIHQASSIVASHCNRVFALENVVETFWPDRPYSSERADTFLLKRTPVAAIASITVDGTILTSTQYRLDAETGFLYRLDGSCYWWSFANAVVVAYSGGYLLLDGLPYSLERAAITLVKEYWSAIARDPALRVMDIPGLGRQEFWVGAIGDPGELPPQVKTLLAPFIRYHVS